MKISINWIKEFVDLDEELSAHDMEVLKEFLDEEESE